jgi:hypothetical protein
MMTIFFPVLTWIIFLGLGCMIWFMKKDLATYKDVIVPMFDGFKIHAIKKNTWKWIGLILL